jgi:hypothetical protein
MNDQVVTRQISALRTAVISPTDQRWIDREPDYLSEYGLTDDHVPALIDLAQEWCDELDSEQADFGPVVAWRALGQLRAAAAVQPLLEMLDPLDEVLDGWFFEDVGHVFGLIGPPAIEALNSYLADEQHRQDSRAKAADGLREIARRFPQTYDQVVTILSSELARHQADASTMNALLAYNLVKLEAVEAAEVIERAFAANVIDPMMVGDWGDLKKELGVAGLGIAPDKSPGWPTLAERFGISPSLRRVRDSDAAERKRMAADQKRRLAAKQREKAKKKKSRQDRKRNRKAR